MIDIGEPRINWKILADVSREHLWDFGSPVKCVCLDQQRCVKVSNNHLFPLQTDNHLIASMEKLLFEPLPGTFCILLGRSSRRQWLLLLHQYQIFPEPQRKAKGPSVVWCITRPSYGSSRIRISKKQLKISYVAGSLLQPQQSEKGRSLCVQQLLLATSINKYPASLQTSLVLHKVESFSRRTSGQPASAVWGRWWEAGKEELLGDAGFTTARQIRREDVHVRPS